MLNFRNPPYGRVEGGSSVVVEDNIKEYHFQKEEVQLTFVSVYTSKQDIVLQDTTSKTNYKVILQQTGERIVIGGDINAKNVE